MNILFTWLGKTDVQASRDGSVVGLGPIGQALSKLDFDEVILLSDLGARDESVYRKWLANRTSAAIRLERVSLKDPTEFREIYEGAKAAIDKRLNQDGQGPPHKLSFHLSPGTPSMAAVWIILAKTRYPAQLIQSSKESGVRTVSLPFDISAEYIPDLLRNADSKLESMALGLGDEVQGFGDLLYQSRSMAKVVELAKRIALHRVSVLIEGETGTGKEVFAKAIHASSSRRNKPLVTVNCGAIPEHLVESELFGHTKGSFTGADKNRPGHFVEADGGTIFLDEVGELPLAAQVKLLRVLQENEVMPVGASRAHKVDVRVISATNRNLQDEIARGAFREDLFYRLAVFVLTLPPLREREGDLNLLINAKMKKLNQENASEIWSEDKELTAAARNLLHKHPWPGNVRELEHTLLRAAVISDSKAISGQDMKQALFTLAKRNEEILDMPLGNGFDINELVTNIKRHFLKRALDQANSNKSEAARLIGLPNYQTFTNWMERNGVSEGHEQDA